MTRVSVVGSLHLDHMIRAPRLPGLDETLMGSGWATRPGGKGGNQAVAAARLGARVAFGGAVGADDAGLRLRAHLVAAGVGVTCLLTDPARPSGASAAIEVDGGDYAAVVVTGANGGLDADAARAFAPLWTAPVLLLQNEVPEAANIACARAHGPRVVLNAAPARPLPDALLALVDVLVVNAVEAAMLGGEAALASPERDVVVTLGARGLVLLARDGARAVLPALAVTARSSHGAGDAFCGALGWRLACGDALPAACLYAAVAAGLHVSQGDAGHAQVAARLTDLAWA